MWHVAATVWLRAIRKSLTTAWIWVVFNQCASCVSFLNYIQIFVLLVKHVEIYTHSLVVRDICFFNYLVILSVYYTYINWYLIKSFHELLSTCTDIVLSTEYESIELDSLKFGRRGMIRDNILGQEFNEQGKAVL